MSTRTRPMVVASLLAAMLAASAWIALPIGQVPVTLQVFIVLLIGLLLPPGWAFVSVSVYLLLGAVGVPVFASGTGGMGVLAGPTGGFLIGFLIAAPLVSTTGSFLRSRIPTSVADAIAALLGVAVIYLIGWIQLMAVTGLSPSAAFIAGVAPFIALDIGKAVVAVMTASILRRSGVVPE